MLIPSVHVFHTFGLSMIFAFSRLLECQKYMDLELENEKELVLRAQEDSDAFGKLFEKYHSKILSYAMKRTGNIEVARDVASETFFKALKKLWQFHWRNVSFAAWLYKIATNEIRRYFRKNRRTSFSLEVLQQENGFEPASAFDLEEELHQAEQKLRPLQNSQF